MATMVSPITTLGTFRIWAREELPSTKKSAPFINKIKPTIRTNNDTNTFVITFSPLK